MACRPSSALITMGLGNVQAKLVLPMPASPQMVAMTGLSAGFCIVSSMMFSSLGYVLAL
jgi:hypothetical protein